MLLLLLLHLLIDNASLILLMRILRWHVLPVSGRLRSHLIVMPLHLGITAPVARPAALLAGIHVHVGSSHRMLLLHGIHIVVIARILTATRMRPPVLRCDAAGLILKSTWHHGALRRVAIERSEILVEHAALRRTLQLIGTTKFRSAE